MQTVHFALRDYLEAHNLSAYRLVQATKGRVAERTVYSLARTETKRVDLEVLGALLAALEQLTGKTVTPNDLLKVTSRPDPVTPGVPSSSEEAPENEHVAALDEVALVERQDEPSKTPGAKKPRKKA